LLAGSVAAASPEDDLGLSRATTPASLIASVKPARLGAYFLEWGQQAPSVLVMLGRQMVAEGPGGTVGSYLAATVRAMAQQLDARGVWSEDDLDRLLTVQLVNPRLFVDDLAFRYQVVALLRQANDARLSTDLRQAMVEGLNQVVGVDFEIAETVAAAWGLIERSSTSRQISDVGPGGAHVNSEQPIEATVLVLTSQFVGAQEAEDLLTALESVDPERDLLVLTDRAMADRLGPRAARTYLLLTQGRSYSPWPRDSLILTRRPDHSVNVVLRPDRQNGREEDANLGRLLVAQLPPLLDAEWGKTTWSTSDISFHNGQILLTQDRLWVSVHSLEWTILRLLETDRVPTESFATDAGIDAYLDAAEEAAAQLGRMFGREPQFVHDLPRSGAVSDRRAALMSLAGGGGFDLDSLITIVAGPDGQTHALVGDLDRGIDLLDGLSDGDVATLRTSYGVAPEVDAVGQILATSGGSRARALDAFLEATVAHLDRAGLQVQRLPLLLAPTSIVAARAELEHDDFLIGWNNVVLSKAPGGHRAEGFASGIPSGDELARDRFRTASVELRYLPPLVSSVIRNGGYRCATNHLRLVAPEQMLGAAPQRDTAR
jgi:hypothetical protein